MSRFLRSLTLSPSLPVPFVYFVCFVVTCLASPLRAAEPVTKTFVCFGDSLTAGYGLESAADDAYPALLQRKLDAFTAAQPDPATAFRWRVINAGLSGETTAGGSRRIDWVLRQPVDIFLLALGGNDGLRGIDPVVSRKNLQSIIDRVRDRYPAARIILAGMMMPPSMGEDYARAFAAMYPALAVTNHLTLVPFLLQDVGGRADLNQGDGVHPTPVGHAVVAETIWSAMRPLLAP
ncbi:MAG: arylesterase [Undibacterium sp.]|nr:arylesterase [Opitutaceae bacterium]